MLQAARVAAIQSPLMLGVRRRLCRNFANLKVLRKVFRLHVGWDSVWDSLLVYHLYTSRHFGRVRDFRGLNGKSFDGRGNYAMGVTEQIIFPEIDYDKIDTLHGLDIAITTTAASDDEGRALLAAMRFPFRGSVPAAESAKASAPAEEVVEETPAAEEAPATNEEKDS